MTFCGNKALLFNLIIMAALWTAASFGYYLITFFLKYIPGNIYVNTSLASLSEITAYICSGFVMKAFGVRLSFIISFGLGAAGAFLLAAFFNSNDALIATFTLFAKFGIAFAFNNTYLATP